MDQALRKFRDRLRVILILYTFSDPLDNQTDYYGLFRSEVKIQAIDFLLRYPDFLAKELMDLMVSDPNIKPKEVENTVFKIYQDKEPEIRKEEMEKFFYGAYESIDDIIAFHISVGFLHYISKKRIDGKEYDRQYFVTRKCADKIENTLQEIPSVKWYIDRCLLIKKYFNRFSGSELKTRQYRYAEYKETSYKAHISGIDQKVRNAFLQHFQRELV